MARMYERLNFLFFNTDQQRYDTLGCNGSAVAKTPNIDRLAQDGVRFARCYTTHPVCMPARASYFTGQYPSHHGVWQNGVPLNPQADTLQNRLKRAGYHTALIGKMHLECLWMRDERHPSYGLDTFLEGNGDPYYKDDYFQWLEGKGLYDSYKEEFDRMGHMAGYTRHIDEQNHLNSWIAGHAEDYLKQRAADARSFFLSVGFFDPHHPFDACEPYASMFEPEQMPMPIFKEGAIQSKTPLARQAFKDKSDHCLDPQRMKKTIAAYHATGTHIDATVGRVVDCLRENGLEDNTVIVFTSDHGEMLGDHGILHKGPLFFEGAVRVPLVYRFPERFGLRGTDTGFVSHIDFAPTIAALAGVQGPRLAQGRALFDQAGTLRPLPARDAALVEWRWRDRPVESEETNLTARCLVTDRWKFVYYHNRDYGELYNLKNDPCEFDNLWERNDVRSVRDELQRRLWEFIIDSEPCPTRTNDF